MSPEHGAKLDIDTLAWGKHEGLIPAIVQDIDSHRVLMLGYMDRAALATTLESGRVTFFSRSRNQQWTKGETSGNFLHLVSVEADCDSDTLLVQAHPKGPTCHLDRRSCFAKAPADFLSELDTFIAARERTRPPGSYTTGLFESGIKRIAQKVGEEGVEAALAGAVGDVDELRNEAADLIYHLIVLLRASGLSLQDVSDVLEARHAS